MPTPPVLSSLVLYWLKDGGVDEFTVPPLEDILAYPPYPAYVNLFAANLMKNQDGKVDIDVPATIAGPLKAGVGRRLKDHGIKVVLSILNATDRQSVGWSTMTPAENEQLVAALGNIKSTYGIDGIDIDDEFMDVEGSPENFYNTVRAIRTADPSLVISNPIYYPDMVKYEKYPDLTNLMTYCSTMNYGDSCQGITGLVQMFNGYGIPMSKLYAGVRPGPPADSKCRDDSFTSIETCRQVAAWAKTNCAGVMMFTFSTDTIEYTACPQHTGWPNPADHGWQKAIQSVLASS
jgi:Glycosyl hydrolases family 18